MTTFKRLIPSAIIRTAADGNRSAKFIFSTGAIGRDGHVIDQNGWNLTDFKKNPVILDSHNASSIANILGRATKVGVEGGQLVGTVEFLSANENPLAERALAMVRSGSLNAVSVSWSPDSWQYSTDRTRPPGSIDFKRQTLLEVSLVAVPADPAALAIERSASRSNAILAQPEIAAYLRAAETIRPNASARDQRRFKAIETKARCAVIYGSRSFPRLVDISTKAKRTVATWQMQRGTI